MWHTAIANVASYSFLHDACAFHFVMSSAASSNFRFLVLRTFFFSKIHLHRAVFCILRFSKHLAYSAEVYPTWRWGFFCQQLLSYESCWLAEALPGFLAVSRTVLWSWSSVKSWECQVTLAVMSLKSSSLTLKVGLQLGASRGSIPWSWSRTLVLQKGGKMSETQLWFGFLWLEVPAQN